MNYAPYNSTYNWYKGNLHGHTVNSDGKSTPEEVKEIYKRQGYHFTTFSEHELYLDYSQLNDSEFIIYKGMELQSYKIHEAGGSDNQNYHMLCFPKSSQENESAIFKQEERFSELKCPQDKFYQYTQNLIDSLIHEREALVTINHPVWSRIGLKELLAIKHYFALEIFNYECSVAGFDSGEAVLYWDFLLREGRRVWGFAADDSHNALYMPENGQSIKNSEDNPRWDSCKAWVCVNAAELSVNSISHALEAGTFYSSTGPIIYDYRIEDSEVIIECSKVKKIKFISYEVHGNAVVSHTGIEQASYKLKGSEKYIRVECVDFEGNTAWTNPIFLEGS